jgi:hypothetical protein
VSRSRLLRIAYAVVVGVVAVGGLVTIIDWARRGGELPGGGVPVTGRVVEERPGFGGALAIVEVAYDAGGKERRARLPVAGSNEHPQVPTYRPGDEIALLVSKTDPDRVQHANWGSDTPRPAIPGWLVALAAAAIITALVLPGAGRRLQSALSGLGLDRPGPAAGRRRWPEP